MSDTAITVLATRERIALGHLLADIPSDRIAAWQDGVAVSGADFKHRVGAWAARFCALDDSRVALFFDDTLDFAAALFGAWHAGKQPWLPGDLLPATLARLQMQVPTMVGDTDVDALASTSVGDDVAIPSLDPRTVSLVVFTSGSSGEPVAIEKTLRQLDDEVAALEQTFGNAIGDASIHGTVSHQHIYGLLFRVLWPLSAGRGFHARRLATPAQIAALPGRLPAALVTSPALLKRLPPNGDWRATGADLAIVFSSGGPLPDDAASTVARLWGKRPVEIFGSTETGGIASRQHAGDAWLPLPRVAWRIHDEQLEVRSSHLSDDSWFTTSDRAVAADGGFRLLGRADRIVKIEERRISLTAIELALTASTLIKEAKVVVMPGERAVIVAVVVPTTAGRQRLSKLGKQGFAQQMRHGLTDAVDAIALPRRWRIVDALPVDIQGKTTDALAQALFRPIDPTTVWLRREPQAATLELDIDGSLLMFDGHFPVTPVLPGVALLDWAVRLGREAFSPPPQLLRTEVLKFQMLVRPGTRLSLVMDWRMETQTLAFAYTSVAGAHASGRLVFGEEARA